MNEVNEFESHCKCEIWSFHGGKDDDVLLGFGTV
jgi:hypothetical protein